MNIKIVYLIFLPAIVAFIACSALILHKTSNSFSLIITGMLFLSAVYVENKYTKGFFLFQLLFLGVFHWISHLDWCYTLYLLIALKPIYRAENLQKSLAVSVLFIAQYTLIRLSYVPGNEYDVLVSFSDVMASIVTVLIIRYIKVSESEKQSLRFDKHLLEMHDPLTGLLNYQEYYKQVEKLIADNRPFVHVLIDCTNFKAMNDEQGVLVGNETLKKIAQFLKISFPGEQIISRQGDKFIVCLPQKENTITEIHDIIGIRLTHWVDLKMIFVYTLYPEETATLDDLFSLTEDKLLQTKRENWLKREEHMLRTEKLNVVGDLAAGMAHELRNPLTTIKGFLQISRNHEFNIRPWYDIMDSEVTRMCELTSEFLQFSRPHIVNVKSQVLQECIERVVSLSESQATFYGHRVHYENELSPIYIDMDRDKIVQVLLNIVKNGLEAMKDTGVISIRLMQKDGKTAVIEIADTGEGIPDPELQRIFDPFYTTKENGTGLGLSVCHKTIQDHNGKIEVQSTLKHGTTFRILLPVSQKQAS
ncbi:ATP-binding protein [Paenibacillus allorhizosphaerae]|uniref:Adaptive-response sensory-kinase SasA n=1 Tax=Paenibacillus allorhizosphaerae TaxID=2849866 RepID=A0ABN7TFL7_9BACL|nr:ATP-binding protein [Paenibacillus allorhizosphaerae]CAG7630895.1 Adaptive-response sensory-kinase SasA [Paenibacillus allorhizosphaerae]